MNKYLRPENRTGLSVSKVNPEIWPTIKSRIRSTDVKLQRLQNLMIKAALPVIKIANKLMTSEKIKELGLACHSKPDQSGNLRKEEGANQVKLI